MLDFDEILALLSWSPTKEAVQFSMRAVIKRGLVAKRPKLMLRRGRLRVCFELTPEGALALDPRLAAPVPAEDHAEAPGLLDGLLGGLEGLSGETFQPEPEAPGMLLSLEEG